MDKLRELPTSFKRETDKDGNPIVYIVYCPVHGISKHLNPFDSGCCLIAVNGYPCNKKYIIFL